MSTASAIPDVIDYLVTTCTASPLLGAASPAVVVVDGPNVTADTLANQRLLWIGFDLTNPGGTEATSTGDWPVLDHARTEDEDGEIVCTAQFWSGSTAMKFNRDGCAAIVDAVAGLLRGTPVSDGPGDTTMGGLVFWSRISATAWPQQQRDDGATVLCVFRITFRARATG